MSRTIPTLKSRKFSHGLLLPMDNRQAGWSSTPEQLEAKPEARNRWRWYGTGMPRLFASQSLHTTMRAHECTLTTVIVKMARLLDFGRCQACDRSVNQTSVLLCCGRCGSTRLKVGS